MQECIVHEASSVRLLNYYKEMIDAFFSLLVISMTVNVQKYPIILSQRGLKCFYYTC